jgi:hypothetical protein
MFRPLLVHHQVSVSEGAELVHNLDPYYGIVYLLYNITLITRHLGFCTAGTANGLGK